MSIFPDTPRTLLARIPERADGDDAAVWSRFVDLYEPAIALFIRGQGDIPGADVQDLVQEILVRLVDVLRSGGYSAAKGRFRAYLAQMTRNLVIDYIRQYHAKRRADTLPLDAVAAEDADELASDTPDAAMMLDLRWRVARHEAACRHVLTKTGLSQQSKDIYRAYALNGDPIDAVAARFGVPNNAVSQVKTRVDRLIAAVEAEFA